MSPLLTFYSNFVTFWVGAFTGAMWIAFTIHNLPALEACGIMVVMLGFGRYNIWKDYRI